MPTGDWAVFAKTHSEAAGKPKSLGSRESMVAKLKLKGINGRVPPAVESRAYFESTRGTSFSPDTARLTD